jgi:hypothetical protein
VQLSLEYTKEVKSGTLPEYNDTVSTESLVFSGESGGLRITMKSKEILYVTRTPH